MPEGTYHHIEGPDHDLIKSQTAQTIKNTLGAVARPHDRIKQAAEIIRHADAEIAAHVADRDAAAASLWFYGRTLGLPRILGVTRTACREILAKALTGNRKGQLPGGLDAEELAQVATEAKLPRYERAAEKLPELSRVVAAARAQRQAAMPFMQDAALALSEWPYNWEGGQIAAHAGVTEQVIWKHWEAARRRCG